MTDQVELSKLLVALEAQTDKYINSLEDADEQTRGIGGRIAGTFTSVVGGAALGMASVVAGAFAGGVAAAYGYANDLDRAAGQMAAGLNATEGELETLTGIAEEVFVNNFGDSVTAAGEAVAEVERQIGLLGTAAEDELGKATESALSLNDAFDADLSKSANAANVLMEKFGLTSGQAFDFIATGFQEGLNSSDDFLDTISEYGGQFSGMGFQADEFFQILDSGLQAGVLGTDKIADSFKEAGVKLNEGGDEIKTALSSIGLDYDELAASVSNGDATWADYFDSIVTGLKDLEDPIAQNQASIAVFGTMAEDLGPGFIESLDVVGEGLGTMVGATDTLAAQYETLPDVMEGWKRRGLQAIAPIGESLLNIAKNGSLVEKAFAIFETSIVPGIELAAKTVDSFMANLDEGMTPLNAFIEAIWDIAPREVLDSLIYLRDDIVPGLGELFEVYIDPILEWVDGFVELQDVLVVLGLGLAAVVVPAVISLLSAFLPVVAVIGGAILLAAAVREAWENDFLGIQGIVQGFVESAMSIWAGFQALMSGDLEGFAELMAVGVQKAVDTAVSLLGNLWSSTQPVLGNFFDSAMDWFINTDWIGLIGVALEFMVEAWGRMWQAAAPMFLQFFADVVAWVESVDWASVGYDIMTFILDAIEFMFTEIPAIMTRFYQTVYDAVFGNDWLAIGTDSITSIILGVQGMTEALGQAFIDMFSGAYQAFKDHWGFNSPSPILIDEVGVGAGQSVVIGIESQVMQVQAAFGSLFDNLDLQTEAAEIGPVNLGLGQLGENLAIFPQDDGDGGRLARDITFNMRQVLDPAGSAEAIVDALGEQS